MRHVHWGDFKVIEMVALDKPFQGDRVPDDLTFFIDTDLLDGLLHVTTDHGVIAPSVVEHQVMAQAGIADDHLQTVCTQVAEGLDLYAVLLRCDNALGEERDGMTAIVSVGIVESCRQTEREICLASLQVVKSFLL